MHELVRELYSELKLTVLMITHDLSEGFRLGTRLLVFDKVRVDPHEPDAYGATITYDVPVSRNRNNGNLQTPPGAGIGDVSKGERENRT